MARESRGHLSWATFINATLFLCAAGLGSYHLRTAGLQGSTPYILVLGTAGTATVLMMALSGIVPVLFGEEAPHFPRTVTLPIVFVSMLLVCVMLWTNTGSSIVLPLEPIQLTLFWASPTILLMLAVIQFVALSLLGVVARRLKRPAESDR